MFQRKKDAPKKLVVPAGYKCAKCGSSGCKLWYRPQGLKAHLLCIDCAGEDQKKDVSSVDAYLEGRSYGRMVAIGQYTPAILSEDDSAYWSFNLAPQAMLDRWESLPTRPLIVK
ncbi:MAG: hypothetical protein WC645_07940 [Candidatus Margulisiibacteriota bacterium]